MFLTLDACKPVLGHSLNNISNLKNGITGTLKRDDSFMTFS